MRPLSGWETTSPVAVSLSAGSGSGRPSEMEGSLPALTLSFQDHGWCP